MDHSGAQCRVGLHHLKRAQSLSDHRLQSMTGTGGAVEVAKAPADRRRAPASKVGQHEDLGVSDSGAAPAPKVEIRRHHVLVQGPDVPGAHGSGVVG